jgi:hypothetical protein
MTARTRKPASVPKKRTGRPRSITPQLEPAIFDGIAAGLSIKAACQAAGCSYDSFSRLWAADEGFRNRAARAYLHGSVFFLANAENRLEAAKSDTIMVAREIAHHARWRAGRLIPAFSEKLAVGVTDADGFFGAPAKAAPPAPDSNSPAVTWRSRPIAEWTSEERIEAAKALGFELVLLKRQLAEVGFDAGIVEGSIGLASRLSSRRTVAT